MKTVQQDILCALLQRLLDQKQITRNLYDKSREKILSTWDWPEFFSYVEDNGKEDPDGSA